MLKRILVATLVASAVVSAPAVAAVTVTAQNGKVTLLSTPKRIVSLSPTATEMLFAVGAGKQVVAVDDQSNFPKGVPTTKLSGFKPNIEAIAKFKPDLVVVSDDVDKIVSKLGKLKIPVLHYTAAVNLKGTYLQIERLGVATGHSARAKKLTGTMRTRMATIVASAKGRPAGTRYYHELDPLFYSVTSRTFIGGIYKQLGLVNIADAGTTATDYPQLSAEGIVAADPQIIFLADTKCCGQTAAKVAARPGWGGISAVKNGAVVELDDDVASRWGPRIVDFAQAVAKRITALPAS
jgi:iron complex transport system substrate-binding protein